MRRLKVGLYPLSPWMATIGNTTAFDPKALLWDFYNFLKYKLDASFHVLPHQVIGDYLENGSWTGSFGMIQRGEFDLILFPNLGYENSIGQVYDTKPYYYTWTSILYGVKNLGVSTGDGGFLVSSFTTEVWTYLFCLLLLMSFMSTLSLKVSVKSARFLPEYVAYVLRYFGFLFTEPFQRVPKTVSSRTLVGTWCLSVLVLQNAYNGNLKSALASASGQRIETLEDIVKRPHLRVITYGNSFFDSWFRDSDLPLMKTIYRMILSSGGDVPTLEQMADRANFKQVEDGKSVFVMDYVPIIKWLGDYGCRSSDFSIPERVVRYHPMTFAINIRLPRNVTSKIDTWMSMYETTGQLKRRIRELETRCKSCIVTVQDSRATLVLTVHHFAEAFMFWASGLGAALAVLILEKWLYFKSQAEYSRFALLFKT